MSRIEVTKCNNCGKETHDFYNENGWISIEGAAITISTGRRKTKDAKIMGYTRNQELHFCCDECLIKYLDELKNEACKRENNRTE